MNQKHRDHNMLDDRMRELRSRLLSQTTGMIRRRLYYRRAGMLAACVGCYLAGMLTVSMLPGATAHDVAGKVVAHETVMPTAAVPDDTATETTETVVVSEPVTDAELQDELRVRRRAALVRMQTPRKKKSRFLSLRDLGDQYLLEHEDPAGAARCYQMALRFATEEEVNQQPDEGTWLFRALKLDHHWETDDARDQG